MFRDMPDSERLAHRETGGIGDEVGSGLEADYEGPGVPRCGFRFYPSGSGEPTEVLKQGSDNIILIWGMLIVENLCGIK